MSMTSMSSDLQETLYEPRPSRPRRSVVRLVLVALAVAGIVVVMGRGGVKGKWSSEQVGVASAERKVMMEEAAGNAEEWRDAAAEKAAEARSVCMSRLTGLARRAEKEKTQSLLALASDAGVLDESKPLAFGSEAGVREVTVKEMAALAAGLKKKSEVIGRGEHKTVVSQRDPKVVVAVYPSNDVVTVTVGGDGECRVSGVYLATAAGEVHPRVGQDFFGPQAAHGKIWEKPTQWGWMGCKVDSRDRILPYLQHGKFTPATCAARCARYEYFGVQHYGECWCGHHLKRDIRSGSCTAKCTNDQQYNCGGPWAMQVWRRAVGGSPSLRYGIYGKYYSVGCKRDYHHRVLSGNYLHKNDLSTAICQAFCEGYDYFGLENGNECFCGNKLRVDHNSNQCNKRCGGVSSETCGGPWALTLYRTAAADQRLARRFAPTIMFPSQTKSYPMDAGVYYDKVFVKKQPAATYQKCFRFAHVTEQATFDPSKMVTYYKIGRCSTSGNQVSIDYLWFYGMQYACLDTCHSVKGDHPGDWERITVVLSRNLDRVEKVRYYQHAGYYQRLAGGFEVSNNRVKAYVGWWAHGSYHTPNQPSGYTWLTCDYYGDMHSTGARRAWHTENSKLLDLVVTQENWMDRRNKAPCQAEEKRRKVGIFCQIFDLIQNRGHEQDQCRDAQCKKEGCVLNQCRQNTWCYHCTENKNCWGRYGIFNSGRVGCCQNECRHKKKDWAGIYFCPHECRGGFFKGKGTCLAEDEPKKELTPLEDGQEE